MPYPVLRPSATKVRLIASSKVLASKDHLYRTFEIQLPVSFGSGIDAPARNLCHEAQEYEFSAVVATPALTWNYYRAISIFN